MRPVLLAALLAGLALSGCFTPASQVSVSVADVRIQPLAHRNETIVEATFTVRVEGTDLKDAPMNFWVQDATRKVLVQAHATSLTILAGEEKKVNVSILANGVGYPVKFVVHGKVVTQELWPPVGQNAFYASRNVSGPATWDFVVPYAMDRQTLHAVVDNTAFGQPPQPRVDGTFVARVGLQERIIKVANLTAGQSAEASSVFRAEERVTLSWTGGPADILLYVGDEVYAQYRAAAGV